MVTPEHNGKSEFLYRQPRRDDESRSGFSVNMSMEDCDEFYANHTLYVKDSIADKRFPHFGNEKKLFVELSQYNHPFMSQQCMNFAGTIDGIT